MSDSNEISGDYAGLEILLNFYLRQSQNKSDVIILLVDYLLTSKKFNYQRCVQEYTDELSRQYFNNFGILPPEYSDEYSYVVQEELPPFWNGSATYRLMYKKQNDIKILIGTKKNNGMFRFYLSKENGSRDQISPEIKLDNFVPDQFMGTTGNELKHINLITNLDNKMDYLEKIICGNAKLKDFKQLNVEVLSIPELKSSKVDELVDRDTVTNESDEKPTVLQSTSRFERYTAETIQKKDITPVVEIDGIDK